MGALFRNEEAPQRRRSVPRATGIAVAALWLWFGADAVEARAQAPEDEAPPAGSLEQTEQERRNDEIYKSVLNYEVAILLGDGDELWGTLRGYDAATVTLEAETKEKITIGRADVVTVRVVGPLHVPPVVVDLTKPPAHTRYLSLQLGLAPSVAADFQYSYFYAFGNLPLIYPAVSNGTNIAFSLGAGATIPVNKAKRFKLDITAIVAPYTISSCCNETAVAIGIGGGFHYTWDGGLTIGVKLPIFGAAYMSQTYYAGGFGSGSRNYADVGKFYLYGMAGLPVFSIGYRF